MVYRKSCAPILKIIPSSGWIGYVSAPVFCYTVRSSQQRFLARMIQLCVVLLLPWLLPVHSAVASPVPKNVKGRDRAARIERLQAVTDDLRARLGIMERVLVTIVPNNPLVFSVETLGTRSGPFVINVDDAFLESLADVEIEAALAHELGHVWIYTHHPYLQTERLANDIALRVVPRSSLEPVYEKVWKRIGVKGNMAEFIGASQQ
jgi:hypothetical protein